MESVCRIGKSLGDLWRSAYPGRTPALSGRQNARLGRLPGDFVFKKGNVTVYLPFGTCLLLSIILTILFSLFSRR